MSPWKRVGIAAVVGIALICSSSVYAKGKPDSPGNSGGAPGQSGGSPGKPDSPGKSGDAPGQVAKEAPEVTVDTPVKFVADVENSREDFLYSEAIRELTPYERSTLSNSSEYEKIKTQMEMTILAYRLDLLTKTEARNRVIRYMNRMEEVTKSGKFLGFMFRCRGILCK